MASWPRKVITPWATAVSRMPTTIGQVDPGWPNAGQPQAAANTWVREIAAMKLLTLGQPISTRNCAMPVSFAPLVPSAGRETTAVLAP
ncbi:hypothetical protein D3C80_1938470 [compost metagenome]